MISQNISRGVLGSVLINISPSNIFPTILLLERFYQNCSPVLVTVTINGLRSIPVIVDRCLMIVCDFRQVAPDRCGGRQLRGGCL